MVDYVSSTKSYSLSENAAEDLKNKIVNLLDKEHDPNFSVPKIREELQDSMKKMQRFLDQKIA